jgi:hypothetical protein
MQRMALKKLPVAIALHAGQAAALLWLAMRSDFCCDAYYYLLTGRNLLAEGLRYHDDFAGYRSYFVPLVLGLLDKLPLPAMRASGQAIPGALALAFVAVSALSSAWVLRRESLGRYLVFALPLLFNPFLLGHVVAPLQESIFMLAWVPLLFVLLAVRERSVYATLGLVVLLGALAFTIRGSFAWVAAPLALFLALEVRRSPAPWRAASRARLAAIALAASVPLVAPQCYIMQQKFGTPDPYPMRWIVNQQEFFGVELFKYATMKDGDGWRGLRYITPWATLPMERKTGDFYIQNKGPGVFLVLTHVWSGLHYDVLTTYIRKPQVRILNPWIVLSSFIVAFGLLGLVRGLREPGERSRAVLLAAAFILSCGYTAFVGVEARFGIIGFAALSLASASLLSSGPGRAAARESLPIACAYVALCLAFNAMLTYSTREY